MKKKLNNILFLLGLPFLLISQSVSDSIILSEINIIETKAEKHSIGISFESISPETLTNSFSESISSILQNSSTVYVKNYGALSTPTFRGTSASHTLFLWNGIPINPVAAAQVDLRLVPTNSFNNLLISYGGNSTVFGSGSVGGSIHLNNYPIYNHGKSLTLNFEKGSFGMSSVSTYLKYSNSKRYFSFHASKIVDANRFPFTYNNQQLINEHAFTEGENINSTLAFVLDNKSDLEVHYWSSNFWREVPGNIMTTNSTAEQTDKSKRIIFSLDRKYKNIKLKLKEAILYDDLFYEDAPKNIDSYSETKSYISELDMNYNYQNLYTDLSLVFRDNYLRNSSYIGLNKQEKSNSIFTAISYRSKIISSELSVRQEYNTEMTIPLIPSVSLELNYLKMKLRARVNKNFRAPTFNDRFWISSGANGNPDLKAENGINKEIGIDYNVDGFSNHITLFSLEVNDWILWNRQDNGSWFPENLKKVHSKGLELKSVFKTKYKNVNIFQELNYQYNLSVNQIGISPLDASVGSQLIYSPKHKGNINTQFMYKKLNFNVNSSFVGSVFTSSDNLHKLDSYILTNLWIKYNITNLKSDLSFIVKNIFNKDYQSYQNYPNPRKEFLIKLTINLN